MTANRSTSNALRMVRTSDGDLKTLDCNYTTSKHCRFLTLYSVSVRREEVRIESERKKETIEREPY